MFKKNSIKISGFKYTIKEVSGLADDGSTSFADNIILINKDLSDDRKKSALIHEVIECFNELGDLGLSHQTIQTLEAFVFAFYKDN
ncbi:MAG: hypothetical protein PHE29_14610 [Tissierellia bacterium]|nr:hypothetical protein [Tissierellia bacterium]